MIAGLRGRAGFQALLVLFLLTAGIGYAAIQLMKSVYTTPNIYLLDNRLKPSASCRKIAPTILNGGDYIWELLTDAAPYAPRDGAGGVVHNGKMVLLGGWNPNDKVNFPQITNNEVWESADGMDWKLLKLNSFVDQDFDPAKDWEGRHTSGFVSYKGYIWLIGGDVAQKRHQHDIWRSRDGKNWELVNDGTKVPWAPRALHITFVLNDRIYVVGGQSLSKSVSPQAKVGEHFYQDVWSTTDGKDWVKHESAGDIWTPRGGIGGQFIFKNRVWIVGGFVHETLKQKNRIVRTDVWSSADAIHWTKESGNPSWAADGGLMYHDVGVFNDRLWIVGGASQKNQGIDNNVNRVWHSADGRNWSELKCSPIAPTHATTVFSFDDKLIISAGNHFTREVWVLRPAQKGR